MRLWWNRAAFLTNTDKNFHWLRTVRRGTVRRVEAGAHRLGTAMILASAVAFGALGVFGKLAFDAGVGVVTLLFVRFSVAAAVLWTGTLRTRSALAGTGARTVLAALALGAIGYAMQAGLFFAALTRMDASLLSMVLYTYPAM